MEKGSTVYSFTYDPAGRPVSVTEGSNRYYYVLNQQGDVVGLMNGNKKLVVEYYYDAWGRLIETDGDLATTLGANNPLRYRGYVYDTETGLYYLQSRYYNPTWGRFINADDPGYMGVDGTPVSYNLFVYCMNNPVNMLDDSGKWPSWATKIAIGIGAIVVGAIVVAATVTTGGFVPAFLSALGTGLKAAAVSGAIGAGINAGTSAINHRLSTGSWDGVGNALLDGAVDGFVNGLMSGGIMAGSSQLLSGGFKLAANAGVSTGRNGGITIGNKLRILSPNHTKSFESGGTLLKIGSKHRNIRFDVGEKSLFHINVQLAKKKNYHLSAGTYLSGLIGGILF